MTVMTFILASAIKSAAMILILWGMRGILRRFVSPRIRAALWGFVPLVIVCPGFFAVPLLPSAPETSLPKESVPQTKDEFSEEIPTLNVSELTDENPAQNSPVLSTADVTETQEIAVDSEKNDSLASPAQSTFSEAPNDVPILSDEDLSTQTAANNEENIPAISENLLEKTTVEEKSSTVSPLTPTLSERFWILSFFHKILRHTASFFYRYAAFLGILWTGGFIIVVFRIIGGIRQCRRWVRLAAPNEDEKLQTLLTRSGESLGVKKLPTLLLTVDAPSPAITGLFKPALLLPADMAETFSEESLRHIFLHELGHFVRRDLFAGMTGSLLLAFYWFNPLLWIAQKLFHADQEEACDALVLRTPQPPARRDYANTLYEIIRRQASIPLPTGSAGMVSDIKTIENRIRTMAFEGKWGKGRLILVLIPLLASTASLSAFSLTASMKPSAASNLIASAISMPLEDITPNVSSPRPAPMGAPADTKAETIADKAEAARLLSEIETFAAQPFEGEPSEYVSFLREKGKKLTQLSHLCLTCPDLTPQETANALRRGILGCMLAADSEEEALQKRKDFLDAHSERPEARPLYHAWIQETFAQIQETLDSSRLSADQQKETLRQTVNSMVRPLTLFRPENRHYYSNPEEKKQFESIPYTLLQMGEKLDPDYSQGFAVELAEKLKPIFEIDLQAESAVNKLNAAKGLQTASRAAATGQTIQYESVNFENKPVSLTQLAGKPILIVFTDTLSEDAAILRQIDERLRSEGLEIIVHALNDFLSDPRQNPQASQDYPWITVYQSQQNGLENNPQKFGVFNSGLLLVNAEGKVILNRSDALSSEMCDTLAQLFPQHSDFLNDCKEEIHRLDISKRNNKRSSQLSAASNRDFSLPNSLKDTDYGRLMRLEFRFRQVKDSYLSNYGFSEESQIEFLNHLLSLPETQEFHQSSSLAIEKYNLLNRIALRKAEGSTAPPETFYAEADQFARDYLLQGKIDFKTQDTLNDGQKERIASMCNHLKTLTEGQEEYAKKIVDYFVSYHQQNEAKLAAQDDSLFSYSWTDGIRQISSVFREIDEKEKTNLENTLYQRVDPYFAELINGESNLIENFQKRARRF